MGRKPHDFPRRAAASFNKPFFELKPTGKSGTSIEYLIMTIEKGQVTKFWVADHTLDLVNYLTVDQKFPYPTNFKPEPIIEGQAPQEQ